MLYLKYQVEEFAQKKWGSFEEMDREFERRTAEKKKRSENKFKTKLRELKKRTRVEAWKREHGRATKEGRHEHVWGALVENEAGETVKTCEECGLELEEMVI